MPFRGTNFLQILVCCQMQIPCILILKCSVRNVSKFKSYCILVHTKLRNTSNPNASFCKILQWVQTESQTWQWVVGQGFNRSFWVTHFHLWQLTDLHSIRLSPDSQADVRSKLSRSQQMRQRNRVLLDDVPLWRNAHRRILFGDRKPSLAFIFTTFPKKLKKAEARNFRISRTNRNNRAKIKRKYCQISQIKF